PWFVNQVKNLPATWGYYVFDEPLDVDHAAVLAHAGYIKTADAAHPRLGIMTADNQARDFGSGTSLFYDCCDVAGDDYYPIGDSGTSWLSTAAEAAGIQNFTASKSLQSALVLQAFGWQVYF